MRRTRLYRLRRPAPDAPPAPTPQQPAPEPTFLAEPPPRPAPPQPITAWALGFLFGLLIAMLVSPSPVRAQSGHGEVQGVVLDRSVQEPLPGVNVVLQGTTVGASTDADGRFRIAPVPAGTYRVEFRFTGFEPLVRTDVVVRPGRATTVNVALRETVIQGEGLTVTAAYFQRDDAAPVSVASFSAEEVRRAPGAAQELARVLTVLPAVASRGETSQDLFVRGGSPAENAFYIDNIPVPNTQHFATGDGSSFGPTGLINTEFVEAVDFSAGGFSAAYGDRLSSVSEIRYREGNANGLTGEVGMNFTGGQVVLESPLGGHREGSFFVSARRSYLDVIAGAINAGGAPSFGDAQGKLTVDLSARHRLSALTLFGTSLFSQDADDAADAGDDAFGRFENRQNTTGIGWRALWRGRGYSNTTLSYSFIRLNNRVDFTRRPQSRLDLENLNQFVTLRNLNRYEARRWAKLEFGAEATVERGRFTYAQGPSTSAAGAPQPAIDRDLRLTGTRAGTFATAIVRPLPRLSTSLGLRADYASLNGTVYLSPRLSASYQLTSRVALNGAYGIYRQGVPLYIVSQNEANEDLSNLQTRHLIAGVDVLLTADTKLTIEAFDKAYRSLPQLAADNPLGDPRYALDARGDFSGALVSEGRGYARGVEALVQKKLARNVYGLASASVFRSRYRDYEGAWRDRDFDARLLLTVVGGYKPSDRWDLSVRWSYLGGRPTTPIDATASADADAEVRDMTRFNEERLPAYHALYVRADRRFFFRSTNLVTFLSLWNAYNRANVEDTYWNFVDGRVDERTQFTLLPIVGIEFEF